MPPGMTRYRRDSPATDIAGQDGPAPSGARTIRTSRWAPITNATADTIQAMLADSAGQDTHDPIGVICAAKPPLVSFAEYLAVRNVPRTGDQHIACRHDVRAEGDVALDREPVAAP